MPNQGESHKRGVQSLLGQINDKLKGVLLRPMPTYGVALLFLALISVIFLKVPNHRSFEKDSEANLGIASLIRSVREDVNLASKEMRERNEPAMFEVKSFDLEVNFVIETGTDLEAKIAPSFFAVGAHTKTDLTRVHKLVLHMDAIPPDTLVSKPDSTLTDFEIKPLGAAK